MLIGHEARGNLPPLVLVGLIGAAALAMPRPALAARSVRPGLAVVQRIQDVAGRSPFTGRHCNVATPYYTSPGGKEGEPYIAVNPLDPSDRIAAWMDATRATVDTAYTTNGGRTWKTSIPRGIDRCTGNHEAAWEASGDPWISFSSDGRAYLSTLTWAHFATPPFEEYVSVVHVQTSTDGGRRWSRPVLLGGPDSVSDKPMVLADPYRPRRAYEIWRNQAFGMPVGARGRTRLYFARTTNRGKTWSRPITIARASRKAFFGNPQLSVLRNGTLVATSSLANPTGATNLLAWRSTDHGRHWRGPRLIRTAPDGTLAPICGQQVAGAGTSAAQGQQTVLNGRSVVLVSSDGPAAAAGTGKLMLSRSNDAGKTWRTRTILRSSKPVLLASIAAGRHDSLGLLWDQIDSQHVDCATQTIPATARFAVSTHAGKRWSTPVTLGAKRWNLASGLRGSGGFSGYFVGDYQALASLPKGFTTATVQGEPLVPGAPPITGANGVMVANILTRSRR